MENKERFVIGLFLGLALIVFLVLLIFLVIDVPSVKYFSAPMSPATINSESNYASQERFVERMPERVSEKTVYVDDYVNYDDDYEDCNRYDRYGYCVEYDDDSDYEGYYDRDRNYRYYYGDKNYRYDSDDSRYRDNSDDEEYYEETLSFNSDSRFFIRKGIFQNDVENYEVYVYNEEEVGGYFEVTYIFEDAYGREKRYSENKYIRPGKDIKFFYRDVTPSYSEYQNVRYEVKSLSKVPYGTSYYN